MKWRNLIMIGSLALSVSISLGSSVPEKLSLDKALQTALTNNPRIKTTKALVKTSRLWSNPETESELTRGDIPDPGGPAELLRPHREKKEQPK
ncbi:hypothetical protein J7M22_11660 [Candidatus Poribacteria bacterium]|nr:hypothetical protein [Candidatus Poribacteria bacterium]